MSTGLDALGRRAARALTRARFRRLGGYLPPGLGPEDVVALTTTHDDADFIEAFLQHHLALGVRGVVVFDNRSEDETAELALRYAPVLVLGPAGPFGLDPVDAQSALQSHFTGACWSLCLDVRTHFDYPGAARLSLARLARHLNAQGADVLLANEVDVFARHPVEGAAPRGRNLIEALAHYDAAGLAPRPPPAPLVAPAGVTSSTGGLAERALAEPRAHRHRLAMTRLSDRLQPGDLTAQTSRVPGVRLADVTGVLWNHRFARPPEARPDVASTAEAPHPRTDLSGLVQSGLLHASTAFDRFVEAHARDRKVFCIGFHKTGTTSMGALLRHLGYRHVGNHRTRDRAFIEDLAAGRLDDLYFVADRANAFEDNPWPLFFAELDARYPGSRFILTTRDLDAWIRSVVAHFGAQAAPDSPMRRLIYGDDAGDPRGHEARYVARHQAHLDAVRAHFAGRPGALLEVDVSQPDAHVQICKFLGHPVDLPAMPHENAAARG